MSTMKRAGRSHQSSGQGIYSVLLLVSHCFDLSGSGRNLTCLLSQVI